MENLTFPLVLKQPEASEWLWLRHACLSDTGHLARYIKTLEAGGQAPATETVPSAPPKAEI